MKHYLISSAHVNNKVLLINNEFKSNHIPHIDNKNTAFLIKIIPLVKHRYELTFVKNNIAYKCVFNSIVNV